MRSSFIICLVSVFVLLTALTVQADEKADQKAAAQAPVTVDDEVVGLCSLCLTCGGNFPIFSGSLDIPSGIVTERGAECTPPLASASDTAPFLCCK